jgi:hypothetical protein
MEIRTLTLEFRGKRREPVETDKGLGRIGRAATVEELFKERL